MSFIKNIFSKKKNLPNKNRIEKFSQEELDKHYEQKEKAIEKVLGKMHEVVGHALIPFDVGGAVDMYYFPNKTKGTGFATMELIMPDGTGPIPNEKGTFELIGFTKHKYIPSNEDKDTKFNRIERRFCRIFTRLGNYSKQARLKPKDTCEIPAEGKKDSICLIFDNYDKKREFKIGNKEHNLLLVIEIFRSEMEHAMKFGGESLLNKLKEKGYYPYSDMDRKPVY